MTDHPKLLVVKDLRTTFATPSGPLPAVGGVSFELGTNETLGIVGESGSGKTVLSRTIMGLQPRRNVEVTGSVLLKGFEVVGASEKEKRSIWGLEVAMIFQDPMTSLNPVMRIGKQIDEILRVRQGMDRRAAKARAVELLELVGIPSPAERYGVFPRELSGGMRQRVVIATALAGSPQLLMADEPTTGLDVTIQAQILNLLDSVKEQMKMSVVLVTHDLGVVATRTSRIIVMYAGRIVEIGSTREVFRRHRMPYTRALLDAIPKVSNPSHSRLVAIPGRPPNLLDLPTGCAFAPRCAYATDICRVQRPRLEPAEESGHAFACWNPLPVAEGALT
ncbi:MAG: oligopeptide/dipeptide transporter, ATP-binding protein [Acidimicrobiaceae bacterium]|nr:oligopeptide/dipeptide transporter, ATP-binding protein [Acidimicrobiaceae bacterium]